MLASGRYAPAARLFLQELYGDRDFSQRDAQFTRVAGTLQKLFPQQVVKTAVTLARLHSLSEGLDDSMAMAWIAQPVDTPVALRYCSAWRVVGQKAWRTMQLAMVQDMDRLTRTPGLRLTLRLMRKPAAAAGLAALQAFLESGFDTFAAMGGAEDFLRTIEQREMRWIGMLFDADPSDCEVALVDCLSRADAN